MTQPVSRPVPVASADVDETDVVFARAGTAELKARIYRPMATSTPRPVLIDIHGGAWSRGDRTTGVLHGRALAAAGFVLVSLDFRQGPDYQHPAASADVAAGVRYVRAHVHELGIDAARIGLVGSSSGGQLALLLAVKPGAPEHVGTPIVRPDGSLGPASGDDTVAFVVALYPVVDPLARYRYVLGRAAEPPPPSGFDAKRLVAAHQGYFPDEAAMAAVSITRIVDAGEARALPPVWLAQPEPDDNVPAALTEAFVKAYRRAGGSIEVTHFPGAGHGFIQRAGPDADTCLTLARDFMKRQLGGS